MRTSSIAGLFIYDNNDVGLAIDCSFASFAQFDSTASTYAVGCQATDRATGDVYFNAGSVATPVWTKAAKGGSSYSLVISSATTVSLMPSSPVGMKGTINGIRIVNGDATKGTLIFSKNGVNFATIVKNGTSGDNQGTPLGNVTFTPTDVLAVQNVGTDWAEVIVDFV